MEKCVVRGCKGKNGPNIKLYRFPKSSEILWCHNLKISPDSLKKSSRLCSRHFTKECGYEKLRSVAMPTLELGHNDDSLSLHYPIVVEPRPIIRERKCHVKDCGVTDPPHKLFGFPHCKEKRNEWIAICQVEKKFLHLRAFYICKMHFRPDMIGKNRLRAHATPLPYYLRVKAKLDKNSIRRCHVKGCKEAKMRNKLHELPNDKWLRNEWIANCNIEEKYLQLDHLFVCEYHFQRDVIDRAKRRTASFPSTNMCNNVRLVNDKPMIIEMNLCTVENSNREEIEHSDKPMIRDVNLCNVDVSIKEEIEHIDKPMIRDVNLCNVDVSIKEEIEHSDKPMIRDVNLCNVDVSIIEEIEYSDEIIIKEEFLSNDEYSDEEFESASTLSKEEIVANEPNLIERNMVNKETVCTNDNLSKFGNMENAAYLDTFKPTLCKEQIVTVLPTEKIKPELEIAATSEPPLCIIKTESFTITEIVCEKCGQSRGLGTLMKIMEENFKHEQQMFLKRIQDLENELKRLKTND